MPTAHLSMYPIRMLDVFQFKNISIQILIHDLFMGRQMYHNNSLALLFVSDESSLSNFD